ncbi:Mrp/NBP35 family ATP-binding protein [Candidatus Bipolaricaulota bacterium]|nr:Mrp/NBP35 family ATP-binding protein [Candidatus Bipolaricaulota bacterium]
MVGGAEEVLDLLPVTGDDPLSLAQLIEDTDEADIVTTLQQLAPIYVRKTVQFIRNLVSPGLGLVENVSGFIRTNCGEKEDLFGSREERKLYIEELGGPFFGIPTFGMEYS